MCIFKKEFVMNMMMRFLCLALMVHVSTAHLHGMEEMDVSENASLLEHGPINSLKKRMRICWEKHGSLAKLLGAGTCTILAFIGVIAATQSHSQSPPEPPACPSVLWNRIGPGCWEYNVNPFTWAIVECQAELLGNCSCVPVCQGALKDGIWPTWVPVGWERGMNLRNDTNCSTSLVRRIFQYALCSQKKAIEAQNDFEEHDISYCKIDTESNTGLVYPRKYLNYTFDEKRYQDTIGSHPEYMEKKCKPLADKARKIYGCKGRFAYNILKKKRKEQKHKRRS
jgi:hypothetical protein